MDRPTNPKYHKSVTSLMTSPLGKSYRDAGVDVQGEGLLLQVLEGEQHLGTDEDRGSSSRK